MVKKSGSSGLTRIAVFYDGNYFLHVSNYYYFVHPKRSRLHIGGLHRFICKYVSDVENVPLQHCQVVDAHYFRGRIPAYEARQRGNRLYLERLFDDILMNESVVTHYLPVKVRGDRFEEKGTDVWLALEAFELAIYKQFDVVVLIAIDGDYYPLVRKLNTLGIRVMVLGWEFEYFDEESGQLRVTRCSHDLLADSSYPMYMHQIVEDGLADRDKWIEGIFAVRSDDENRPTESFRPATEDKIYTSIVRSMKEGYGFITHNGRDLFFYYGSLQDADFNELHEGDTVEYTLGRNAKGDIAENVRKLQEQY